MQPALESTLFFETPDEICARVHREVMPRTATPRIRVEFCEFANANSLIRLEKGELQIRITDLLNDAPAPVIEALAWILISKLYRKAVPRACNNRYRLYLNRRDVRTRLERLRQERGRKQLRPPRGHAWDLVEMFDELNQRFFGGMMTRPELGWSVRTSKSTLGHYDPCHHAIVLSRVLDRPDIPRVAVEFVMFHEMLHLVHPVEHRGLRRCVHTAEFREAEKAFPAFLEARAILKAL